jgi:hypothetical protein
MVNPPKEGEPSYEVYARERDAILGSLKDRALRLAKALNTLDGVTCNDSEGAMYAFPQIRLPVKACQQAKEQGVTPDFLYCKEVRTGSCTHARGILCVYVCVCVCVYVCVCVCVWVCGCTYAWLCGLCVSLCEVVYVCEVVG